MTEKQKINALLVSPVSPSGAFWPIPPDGGYAPQWNAYRLAEGLADNPLVHLTVLFPCTQSQLSRFHRHQLRGRYEQVVYPDRYIVARQWLKKRLPIIRGIIDRVEHALLRSTTGVSLWTYYNYLHRAQKSSAWKQADIIIQNTMSQLLPYYLKNVPREKLTFFCRGQIGIKEKPVPPQTVKNMSECSAVLVASKQMVIYVQKLLDRHIPKENHPKIYIIPNGLGPEFLVPPIPPDRFVRTQKRILFAGRICDDKGVKELVQAFLKVHNKYPQVKLRMVGAASFSSNTKTLTEYEHEVQQLLTQLPSDVVEFTGYIPYQEMPNQYAQADIAVFPSIVVEGFGMVALEAMRCGLPVIASDRAGFRDLVKHGETGFLVDPKDIDQLASAMVRLIDQPSLARQMGEKGYQRSLQYGVEQMVEHFIDFTTDFVGAKQ